MTTQRVKTRVGVLKEGQVFYNGLRRVTGLGNSWFQHNDDETMYGIYGGIGPEEEGCFVQYAYYENFDDELTPQQALADN